MPAARPLPPLLQRVIGITLQWERLNYSVTVGRRRQRKQKPILQGISGHVESGHLLAIMGPTGAWVGG